MEEEVYKYIINMAVSLHANNKKMHNDELLSLVNSQFPYFQYGNLRRVYRACWDRATDAEKEALELSFIDKNGKSLL